MALGKRKRSSSVVPKSRAVSTAMRVGNWASLSRASRARNVGNLPRRLTALYRQVRGITRTIETKEGTRRIDNVQLAHNNLTVFNLNPFYSSNGTGDPMEQNTMNRIGDQITVKGLLIKFFIETSLQRSNVHFKFYLVRMAKGDTLDRTTFFKNCAGNKMIDQANTERFTILAGRTVRVTTPNNAPTSLVIASGVPNATTQGIAGTRIVSMWVPGRKFGRGGTVQYEPGSQTQTKFFDYKLCCVAYDWYGTPQDTNNVGFVNDGYMKLYFKDA